MTVDEIDSFAAMFSNGLGDHQRKAREERAEKERRTQQSDKQRRRGAVRTTQINFRCSPAFREQATAMAAQLDCSVADVMERALELLAHDVGSTGPSA
jgi:predicted HicB family RNase H-like nuclease